LEGKGDDDGEDNLKTGERAEQTHQGPVLWGEKKGVCSDLGSQENQTKKRFGKQEVWAKKIQKTFAPSGAGSNIKERKKHLIAGARTTHPALPRRKIGA